MRGSRRPGAAARRGAAAALAFVFVAPAAALAQAAAPARQVPVVQAVARTTPIVVDGRLDEDVWRSAPAATGFVQQDPHEGQPATQRTEVRVAWDSEALYIGARMFDSLGAAGVRTRLGRRDESLDGDWLQLTFDTYHDHAGRTVFTINPSGVKGDAGQATTSADPSWDPVYAAATRIDSAGWTAELRIPFGQLRFPRDSVQTWGAEVVRYVERLHETSMWSFWGKNESGGPQRYGHLAGIHAPGSRGRVELLPYVLSRARYATPAQPGDPFQGRQQYDTRVGGDLRYQLSSTLTLDATINPDFGQVEVDPAVVNLSAFETFFDEKRPFFVAESGMFRFGSFACFNCSNISPMTLFYSRRIGRAPQGSVTRGDAEFVRTPESSTILGAAKVTGRTRGGVQLGLLDAVTGAGIAQVQDTAGGRFTQEVEPATNYFVGRVRKFLRGGNASIGAMGTSVVRRIGGGGLEGVLPGKAGSAGVDWESWWGNHTYHLMGNFAVSDVRGDSLAILRLQRSSARYFQRPDRVSGGNGLFSDALDASATALRGYGGYLRMARDAGAWQWEGALSYRSPGFEVNDAAFQQRADFVWALANVRRQWNRPTRFYRSWQAILGGQREQNYDGDLTAAQLHFFTSGELPNYWTVSFYTEQYPRAFDDRLTRGGPVVGRPSGSLLQGEVTTDSRRPLVFSTSHSFVRDALGGHEYTADASLRFKPATNVQLTIGPAYDHALATTQFVTSRADPTATAFAGQRVVVADLRRTQLSMDTRLSWTFTPTLTLELFAQPFLFAGAYSNFKEYTATRTTRTRVYGRDFGSACYDAATRRYTLDPAGDCATAGAASAQAFSFDDPDLNVRSLRGNAVLRWEYRPGSTLYVVWQQEREGDNPYGDFQLSRDAGGIFRERPNNIFVVKASFWIGR